MCIRDRVGIVSFAFLAPTLKTRMAERFNPVPSVRVANTPSNNSQQDISTLPGDVSSSSAPVVGVDQTAIVEKPPSFSGCMATSKACVCVDTVGSLVDRPVDACRAITAPRTDLLAGGTFPEPKMRPLPVPPEFVPYPMETGHGLEDLRRALRQEYGQAHAGMTIR